MIARGLAEIAAFTPSDAAHVLGRQTTGNAEAAELGAELFRRRKNARGQPIADSAEALSARVLTALTRRSAEAILETAFADDRLDGAALAHDTLTQRALDGAGGVVRLAIVLDRPVIGLGASAALHYASLPRLLGGECLIPEHADVANAIGAVVGQVSVRAEAQIASPVDGLFRVRLADRVADFASESAALAFAEDMARAAAIERAGEAGTDAAEVTVSRDVKAAMIEGRRMFVEATVSATATGRPRIAVEA